MRRRQRFTIERPNGVRFVALGYTVEGMREACWNRYGEDCIVTRGDYRAMARAAEVKAAGGYTIDHRALRDAIALLGLRHPVQIKFNGRVGSTNGNHRFNGYRHAIMLKSYLTPEKASHALWHELCHAQQAENAGSLEGWARVTREQRRWPYRIRPIEVEANKLADTMADCPLAV